jgi:hypothetical protein
VLPTLLIVFVAPRASVRLTLMFVLFSFAGIGPFLRAAKSLFVVRVPLSLVRGRIFIVV